jgi:hypothetical protein
MTFLFSPCWRYSYWTFGINVGNLLEPSLCHRKVCDFWMLEVTFSPRFMCNCWKMSPWIQEEFTLFPRKSSQIGHACADILEMTGFCLHLLENFLYAQQATDWFIQEREKVQELHYLLSRSPNKDELVFHCKKLLLMQWSFGNCNLTYIFGTLHCSPYLENPTTLPLWHSLKLSIQTY